MCTPTYDSSGPPDSHPKRHLDQVSRFADFTVVINGQTDRETDLTDKELSRTLYDVLGGLVIACK